MLKVESDIFIKIYEDICENEKLLDYYIEDICENENLRKHF